MHGAGAAAAFSGPATPARIPSPVSFFLSLSLSRFFVFPPTPPALREQKRAGAFAPPLSLSLSRPDAFIIIKYALGLRVPGK